MDILILIKKRRASLLILRSISISIIKNEIYQYQNSPKKYLKKAKKNRKSLEIDSNKMLVTKWLTMYQEL